MTPAKSIRRARIHLRDHRLTSNSGTSTSHTSWPEPCFECDKARELLAREQPELENDR